MIILVRSIRSSHALFLYRRLLTIYFKGSKPHQTKWNKCNRNLNCSHSIYSGVNCCPHILLIFDLFIVQPLDKCHEIVYVTNRCRHFLKTFYISKNILRLHVKLHAIQYGSKTWYALSHCIRLENRMLQI